MTSIFEAVETYGSPRAMPLGNGSEASLRIGSFTPAFPAFIGVSPQLGRTFTPDDVASGIAALAPARRATRVDPVEALRSD